MTLSLLERETIINFNDAESTANIFTASEVQMKKMKDLGTWTKTNGGWEIDVPKAWVKIKPPKAVSEAQRAASRRNVAMARKKIAK